MKTSWNVQRAVMVTSTGIALGMILAVVLWGAYGAPRSVPTSSSSHLTPATGGTQQWAFGGTASSTFSCANASCFPNATAANLTLSWTYYIQWVVIYTQTNVSPTQTQIEGQTALNASATFDLGECIANYTNPSAPCTNSNVALSLSGKETSVGFTNLTNGTVWLTPTVGTPGSVAALAIMNANSNEAFNFTGGYTVTGSGLGAAGTGSVSFDIGASETSSVAFTPDLGIVPLNPVPGDTWNASAPFSAHGSGSAGYSITASAYGQSYTQANWTSIVINPTGTLTVNGTDLGNLTLTDNFVNPPTSVTAQIISLDFGNGEFAAADGWVMVPTGLTSGLLGTGLANFEAPRPALVSHPGISSLSSGESAYYQKGSGFIGASATGNLSIPIGPPGSTSPSVNIQAGPEPLSVAQKTYSSITASAAKAASSFPIVWLVVAVVVILVVLVGLVVWRRSARRRPPVGMTPGGAPMGAYPGMVPPPPGPPAPGSYPPTPTGPAPGQPGQ